MLPTNVEVMASKSHFSGENGSTVARRMEEGSTRMVVKSVRKFGSFPVGCSDTPH